MPLRRTILYLAAHKSLRNWMETSPAARRLSRRFVAGSSLKDALSVVRRLHEEGITATLDYLGENVKTLTEAAACRDKYLAMLEALKAEGLDPNVSLKLTQFGLDLDESACQENVEKLVCAAAGMDGFVRIDMESSVYTDRTLGLVRRLHAKHPSCGTVIQAYLRRSADDIRVLERERIRVRLCKGAYLEPPEFAFQRKSEVDANYLMLAKELLATGEYPAIATHDEPMIRAIEKHAAAGGVARDGFEFQMLYGIRRDLQRWLVAEGYRLRVYVPFGEAWYPYFMRRLAERPANLLFLLRNLLRG